MNAQVLFLVIVGANGISLALFAAPRLLARIRLAVAAPAWGRSGGQTGGFPRTLDSGFPGSDALRHSASSLRSSR